MIQTIENRLKRLENAAAPEVNRPVHLLACKTEEEERSGIADMVAAGCATSDDLFIVLVPLKPLERAE